MRTAKQPPADLASSRRAQPLRNTRTNPTRSSLASSRNAGPRNSLSASGAEDTPMEIFPAITHFADAITALPKELVRHFTLLKEVDAKIFLPEEELGRLVTAALNAPLPRAAQPDAHHALGLTSAPMSAQASLNGSITNGNPGSLTSVGDATEAPNAWDPANIPRRQLYQHCAYTMQNMLVSLDEKNHVISTASEALNKQLARIDECFPYIELEISEEARYGSTTHWAYPENRQPKPPAGISRREIAAAQSLSAAAQQLADEAAARSEARKQAMMERRKGKNQHIESDFDDQDTRHKDKKSHGNAKVKKAADASNGVGSAITNGATNSNPPKRRKIEKGPTGGVVMEKPLGSVFGSNGPGTKGKAASPRETPVPEAAKKKSRAAAANGQARKRNNTTTSAMSPSLASSPIRSTFSETKAGKGTSPPTNGRPSAVRGRQNSTQSLLEKRPQSSASNKPNGTNTPDLAAAAAVTGRSIPEVKVTMKETANNSKEHLLEDIDPEEPGVAGGVVVGNKKDITAKLEPEIVGENLLLQTVTTKSGRASKPSTPAISQFPDPGRAARSSRTADSSTASATKRSHKKGAGQATQLAQQVVQNGDVVDDEEEVEAEVDGDVVEDDEPRYCYCDGVSYGEMVGCDSDTCEREWFHLECVGLKVAPVGKAKWYCDDCKEKLKQKRPTR
ncbi:PHD-finger domain-containing protein [Diplocarpon rosae]|nr:PHD-finger domain-containing protein [Diplocarpon rosae]